MNTFHRSNSRKYLIRTLIAVVAITAIVFYMNKDVSDRSHTYALNRDKSSIEYPSIMDRLCFRRFVWVTESENGETSDNAYRIDLFGVERDYRRDNSHPKYAVPKNPDANKSK